MSQRHEPSNQSINPTISQSADVSNDLLRFRLIELDSYTRRPDRLLDYAYSPILNLPLSHVPVIRVFGSTINQSINQSICVHVHRCFPYLYAAMPLSIKQDEHSEYQYMLRLAVGLQEAIKQCQLKKQSKKQSSNQPNNQSVSSANIQKVYVYDCTLHLAYDYYGYHSVKQRFIKISLTSPHLLSLAASILLSGALINQSNPSNNQSTNQVLQPYEAHIPYCQQFLIDRSINGMDVVHVKTCLFREPVPSINHCINRSINQVIKKSTNKSLHKAASRFGSSVEHWNDNQSNSQASNQSIKHSKPLVIAYEHDASDQPNQPVHPVHDRSDDESEDETEDELDENDDSIDDLAKQSISQSLSQPLDQVPHDRRVFCRENLSANQVIRRQRISSSMLEADCVIDDIINSSLIQPKNQMINKANIDKSNQAVEPRRVERVVQSLKLVWDNEKKRRAEYRELNQSSSQAGLEASQPLHWSQVPASPARADIDLYNQSALDRAFQAHLRLVANEEKPVSQAANHATDQPVDLVSRPPMNPPLNTSMTAHPNNLPRKSWFDDFPMSQSALPLTPVRRQAVRQTVPGVQEDVESTIPPTDSQSFSRSASQSTNVSKNMFLLSAMINADSELDARISSSHLEEQLSNQPRHSSQLPFDDQYYNQSASQVNNQVVNHAVYQSILSQPAEIDEELLQLSQSINNTINQTIGEHVERSMNQSDAQSDDDDDRSVPHSLNDEAEIEQTWSTQFEQPSSESNKQSAAVVHAQPSINIPDEKSDESDFPLTPLTDRSTNITTHHSGMSEEPIDLSGVPDDSSVDLTSPRTPPSAIRSFSPLTSQHSSLSSNRFDNRSVTSNRSRRQSKSQSRYSPIEMIGTPHQSTTQSVRRTPRTPQTFPFAGPRRAHTSRSGSLIDRSRSRNSTSQSRSRSSKQAATPSFRSLLTAFNAAAVEEISSDSDNQSHQPSRSNSRAGHKRRELDDDDIEDDIFINPTAQSQSASRFFSRSNRPLSPQPTSASTSRESIRPLVSSRTHSQVDHISEHAITAPIVQPTGSSIAQGIDRSTDVESGDDSTSNPSMEIDVVYETPTKQPASDQRPAHLLHRLMDNHLTDQITANSSPRQSVDIPAVRSVDQSTVLDLIQDDSVDFAFELHSCHPTNQESVQMIDQLDDQPRRQPVNVSSLHMATDNDIDIIPETPPTSQSSQQHISQPVSQPLDRLVTQVIQLNQSTDQHSDAEIYRSSQPSQADLHTYFSPNLVVDSPPVTQISSDQSVHRSFDDLDITPGTERRDESSTDQSDDDLPTERQINFYAHELSQPHDQVNDQSVNLLSNQPDQRPNTSSTDQLTAIGFGCQLWSNRHSSSRSVNRLDNSSTDCADNQSSGQLVWESVRLADPSSDESACDMLLLMTDPPVVQSAKSANGNQSAIKSSPVSHQQPYFSTLAHYQQHIKSTSANAAVAHYHQSTDHSIEQPDDQSDNRLPNQPVNRHSRFSLVGPPPDELSLLDGYRSVQPLNERSSLPTLVLQPDPNDRHQSLCQSTDRSISYSHLFFVPPNDGESIYVAPAPPVISQSVNRPINHTQSPCTFRSTTYPALLTGDKPVNQPDDEFNIPDLTQKPRSDTQSNYQSMRPASPKHEETFLSSVSYFLPEQPHGLHLHSDIQPADQSQNPSFKRVTVQTPTSSFNHVSHNDQSSVPVINRKRLHSGAQSASQQQDTPGSFKRAKLAHSVESFNPSTTPFMSPSITSQIPTPSPLNQSLPPEIQPSNSSASETINQLTIITVEVHTTSRDDLFSDPAIDCVIAVIWHARYRGRSINRLSSHSSQPFKQQSGDPFIRSESGVLMWPYQVSSQSANSSISQSTKIPPVCLSDNVSVRIFPDEQSMFQSFTLMVRMIDPDVVCSYEAQKHGMGYLFERARLFGINMSEEIGRISTKRSNIPSNDQAVDQLDESFDDHPIKEEDDSNEDPPNLPDHQPDEQSTNQPGDQSDIQPADQPVNPAATYAANHGSGLSLSGRIVLNIWRLLRDELKLTSYTIESVAAAVCGVRLSSVDQQTRTRWWNDGITAWNRSAGQSTNHSIGHSARQSINQSMLLRFPGTGEVSRVLSYHLTRVETTLAIIDRLDMLTRTSELARVFGIKFAHVLDRGSQFRVESMMLRLTKPLQYVCPSMAPEQRQAQAAIEALPLVMEPVSHFYTSPVIVLDFQSLYPSMMIAYNICYSTCLGKLPALGAGDGSDDVTSRLGGFSLARPARLLYEMLGADPDSIWISPSGCMFTRPGVRPGLLPRMLNEILTTRIMVKNTMKRSEVASDRALSKVLNARQFGLKLISNVTYGYTSAGFSGRMPCAEIADAIVSSARSTLERAIETVESNKKWRAKVVYGDTDSLFVHVEGRSREEAFSIGAEIAATITANNPSPVILQMEKVYHPCLLIAKKRYVGQKFDHVHQTLEQSSLDAKGIEMVRRDGCPLLVKVQASCIQSLFQTKDVSKVRDYVERAWHQIYTGSVSIQDCIFAKEVRLGTYRMLPQAAVVATNAVKRDVRSAPLYGERVEYVVVDGHSDSERIRDKAVSPAFLLTNSHRLRICATYYIEKQLIPPLGRLFDLIGVSVKSWFTHWPRPRRRLYMPQMISDASSTATKHKRRTIDHYYTSEHCPLCDEHTEHGRGFCRACRKDIVALSMRVWSHSTQAHEKYAQLLKLCRMCMGGGYIGHSLAGDVSACYPGDIECVSHECPVYFARHRARDQLREAYDQVKCLETVQNKRR